MSEVNEVSEQYYLPEIDIKTVECRAGEMVHWLNHLNAVVENLTKQKDKTSETPSETSETPLKARVASIELSFSEINKTLDKLKEDYETTRTEMGKYNDVVSAINATIDTINKSVEQLKSALMLVSPVKTLSITTSKGVTAQNASAKVLLRGGMVQFMVDIPYTVAEDTKEAVFTIQIPDNYSPAEEHLKFSGLVKRDGKVLYEKRITISDKTGELRDNKVWLIN